MPTPTREEKIAAISAAYENGSLAQRLEAKDMLNLPLPATDSTPFITVTQGLEQLSDPDLDTFYGQFVSKGWIK